MQIGEVHKDAAGIVTKAGGLCVKTIRESTREVDFVASTDTIDAHRDVIDQDSWQLDHYRDNPIVLYGHQSFELPIGQCTNVEIRNGRLECTVKFASADANPRAEEVWKLVQEKVLRAVSVGFLPKNGRYEMRDSDEVWVWSDCVLKEISVVAVPANPDALAKTKAAMIDAAKIKDSGAGVPAKRTENPADTTGTKGTNDMKTAEQLQKELDDKTAAHAEATKKLADANVRIVETEQKADKAEAAKTVAEKSFEDASAKIAKLEGAAKTLETEHTKACTDRDAATARAEDAEGKLIELEVEALVGKKIAATEKGEFVELRKSNEKLFKSMVEKRPEMKLTERVTGNDDQTIAGKGTGVGDDATTGWNSL